MITNDEELVVVRQQVARCDAVIESYRKELLPSHERNFNLYAGAWIEMRQSLQADIDAYLRSKSVSANGPTGAVAPADPKALAPAGEDRSAGNHVT